MSLRDLYERARAVAGGVDPIEAGLLANLADRECRHGRLSGDPGGPCGCWLQETVVSLRDRGFDAEEVRALLREWERRRARQMVERRAA